MAKKRKKTKQPKSIRQTERSRDALWRAGLLEIVKKDLKAGKQLDIAALAAMVNTPYTTVTYHLKALVRAGKLSHTKYKGYSLPTAKATTKAALSDGATPSAGEVQQ